MGQRLYGAPLVAQTVKNHPAVQDTRDWSLGQEDPWKREWLPTPVFLPGEFHGQRSLEGYSPWDRKETQLRDRDSLTKTLTDTSLKKIYRWQVSIWKKCSTSYVIREMEIKK